jgi:thioesterase domain-containing protein/acyl carrier protein
MKNVEDIYPLTGMQQLMLVHALRGAGAALLEEQLACTIAGEFDTALLREAWGQAIARHPALRTAVAWQGLERPLQVVRQKVELPWTEHDWRDLSPDIQRQRLATWLADDRGSRFDLTRAPLIKLTLFRLADARWRFVCRAHHLLFDGWSLAVLLRDVLETHEALRAGRPIARSPIPAFREYLRWIEKQDASRAESFWREAFAGFRSPTPIGTQRAAPIKSTSSVKPADADSEQQGPTEHRVFGRLSAANTAELAAAARRWHITLGAFVHGAWAALLARHTNTRDVVFGTTLSGRPGDLPGVEQIVGPFINNVPLRVRLDGSGEDGGGEDGGGEDGGADQDQTVAAWLKQVHEGLSSVAAHQYSSLFDIERLSQIDAGARLFDSLVVFENHPLSAISLDHFMGLKISDLTVTASTAYPLALVATPGEEMSLELRCSAERFSAAEAEAVLGELMSLLASLPRSAERPLKDYLIAPAVQSPLAVKSEPAEPWRGDALPTGGAAIETDRVPRDHIAPRDETQQRLAEIWSVLLGREVVGVRDDFFELGGNSLMAVRLMAEVERQFGRKLPLVWMFQEPTIERLADVLRSGDEPAACLVPIRPPVEGSGGPLFCIHPAGGTVFCYRELARRLPAARPVFGLQARGIDGRVPPRASIAEMASDYAAEITAVQPSGPYLLMGWSLGGLIAFETARQMAAAGHEIGLLAVIDAGMIRPGERFSDDDFLPMLLQLFPREYRPSEEEMKNLSPGEQLDFFRGRAELAGLVVGGDSPIQDQQVFQVFQANMAAVLEYEPSPYAGRLTLFRAEQDATPLHREPGMGWLPWAQEGVDERQIAGEHVNLFRDPYVSQLAGALERMLAERDL